MLATSVISASPTTDYLPEWTWSRAVTDWAMDPFLFIAAVWVTGFYLYGVSVLKRRGDSWPLIRTICFVVIGMGSFVFSTQGGVALYDTVLLSTHMVQHMILSMVVPLALALGAPVTLMMRTLPGSTRKGPKKWLLTLLHSKFARVMTFPPLTLALYVLSPWALYFTSWYDASLDSTYVHQMMHVHLVLIGAMFFAPLLGTDPLPGRVTYPIRMLMLILTLPFHAFLGITIMSQDNLIGEEHYTALREGPMGAWLPSIADDQHLAGSILWASGELVGVGFLLALFVQWVRQSMQEAKQVDRALDRDEARRARAAAAKSRPRVELPSAAQARASHRAAVQTPEEPVGDKRG